jgi:hypothetical protein
VPHEPVDEGVAHDIRAIHDGVERIGGGLVHDNVDWHGAQALQLTSDVSLCLQRQPLALQVTGQVRDLLLDHAVQKRVTLDKERVDLLVEIPQQRLVAKSNVSRLAQARRALETLDPGDARSDGRPTIRV